MDEKFFCLRGGALLWDCYCDRQWYSTVVIANALLSDVIPQSRRDSVCRDVDL
jgi:hypothetical protein